MDRWLGRHSDWAYALMRIVVGLLFMCHGGQKLFGVPPAEIEIPTTPLVVSAGLIELIGGGLVAIGLFAGYAAFIASGEMAVAYFMMHAPGGFWPTLHGGNEGEPAVFYCFVFLYIAFKGSGPLSVDDCLKRWRRGP